MKQKGLAPILIVFALFSLPLIFFPWTFLAFELPKVLAFYFLSSLLLIGLIISKPKVTHLNLTHILAIIFIIWLIISSFMGVDFSHSFWGNYFRREGLITWIAYLVIFITAGVALKEESIRKQAAWAVVISSSIVAGLGIIQFISLWFFGNLNQLLYSGRIISTFGQPNFLGAFLVQSLPFFWYLQLSQKGIKKYLALFLASLVVLAVILTFSRSSMLALLTLLLMWGILHWRMFLGLLTGLVVIFAILANLFPLLVFKEWSRVQVDLNNKWTSENRILIAQRSEELIAKSPIYGFGVENFILSFPTVVQPGDFGLKDIVVDSAHNIFLDIGVESGLVGLTIFMFLIASLFVKGFKKMEADREQANFQAILLTVLLTFLIAHQFSVLSVVPLILFWLAAGGISGPIFTLHLVRLAKLPTVVVLLVILTPVCYFMIQNIRADMLFRYAYAYEVADIKRAIKLDNEAILIAPWVKFYTWRRDFLLRQLGQ